MEKTCACGKKYSVRSADWARGWGRSCSKSCAAINRTKKESRGDFSRAKASKKYNVRPNDLRANERSLRFIDDFDPSWDAHKNY